MSNWRDFGLFGGLRIYGRLFTGDLSDFICCDERFMLAGIIRKIYQLSVRIYQGLAFGGVHRMELAGKMNGKLQGLLWLEESICELASLCGLAHLSRIWRQRGNAYWQAFEEYLTDLLTRGECPEGSLAGYIDAHLHLLGGSVYRRDLYHNIALALYPTFREDPSLWGLLTYMGNMIDYATLQEWLTGLQSRMPEELHQQYRILRGVLM